MPEIDFFFSLEDPSLLEEALRLGNCLLVNKGYEPAEDLILLAGDSISEAGSFRRFFVLPNKHFVSEISMDDVAKQDDDSMRYIMQRIGAASIDLILYKKPSSESEVCAGSLGFHAQTYTSVTGPLEPRPPSFSRAFRSLRSFIKRSAEPVSNKLFPKTVYVFPQAMALLRQDFSRSPWPSIEIAK